MFTRSRRRLTYLFTLPMGLILIVFSSVIYFFSLEDQISKFDKELRSETEKITKRTEYIKQEDYWEFNYRRKWHLNNRIKHICWYDRHGILKNSHDDYSCNFKLTRSPGSRTVKYHQSHLIPKIKFKRELTLEIKANEQLIGYLQVAQSLKSVQEELAKERLLFSLGIPITLGFIGVVGWYLGGLAMEPTKRSYEQLQRFTADASHELRAPVAAILSNAQVGLLAPENNAEQPRQRLENIVDISKTMSTLISNLLFLARHEGKLNPQDLQNCELVKIF